MRSMLCLCVVALSLIATQASAAVVTVTPNPQPTDISVGQAGLGETTLTRGWSIATNAKGWGKLSGYGPSTYQSRDVAQHGGFYAHYLSTYNDVYYPDTNMGRGAFFATCDMYKGTAPKIENDWTPSSVWLGTDTWNGQSVVGKTLGSISKLEYFSFCGKTPIRYAHARTELQWWGKSSHWNGPQQPIQLQLTIQSPDASVTRQVWYRPWGSTNMTGDDGLDEPVSGKGRWQLFNCLSTAGNEGKWYMPCYDSTPNGLERGWYADGGASAWEVMLSDSLPEGNHGPFSNWKLVATSKSPGWPDQPVPPDPNFPNVTVASTVPTGTISSTGTGKPINFFIGARASWVYQLRDGNGVGIPDAAFFQQGGDICWVNSSYGARAQIDRFTLGFNGVSETYDFEPASGDPPAHIMYSSHKSLDVLRNPVQFAANQWNGNLFRVTGRVGFVNNQWFELEDGSKLQYLDMGYSPDWTTQVLPGPIRVYLPDDWYRGTPWWINGGELVSVSGYIEPLRFAGSPSGGTCASMLMMWTNINSITMY